jgi:ABC-type branched-subunit amino acid transport system permease subunit
VELVGLPGVAVPDLRGALGRLASRPARPGGVPDLVVTPTGPACGPVPGGGRTVRAGRPADPPDGTWWRRLGGCLLLAALAALVTGPSGDAAAPLEGPRGALAGARGLGFLSGGTLTWLALTGWPYLRGPGGHALARLRQAARDRADARRDQAGLRGRQRARARPAPAPGADQPVAAGPVVDHPVWPVAPSHRTWAVRSKWAVRATRLPVAGASLVAGAAATPDVAGGPTVAVRLPAGTTDAARPAAWYRRRPARAGGRAAALVGATVAPLLVSTAAQQSMVNDIGLYALLALGLNVVVGCAGLLDLGYIAFFAIGAYTTAYLCSPTAMPWHAPFHLNPFLVIPAAVAAAALAGIALGGPTLRLRGDYLAIVTLGFGEIVQLLANNADGITGGARGVFGVPPLSVRFRGFHYAWGLAPLPYYYLLLALVVLVTAVLGVWERSRTGRAWAAIRQDEVAAAACGVRTVRMKLLAFAVGASVSGFAGVILATKQFFNPQTFSLQASLLVLTIVVFGGMGSRLGVVLGAVVLQGLAFFLRDRVPAADRFIYFGALVVVMMVFRPQGLLPARPGPPERRPAAGVPAPQPAAAGPPPAGAPGEHGLASDR